PSSRRPSAPRRAAWRPASSPARRPSSRRSWAGSYRLGSRRRERIDRIARGCVAPGEEPGRRDPDRTDQRDSVPEDAWRQEDVREDEERDQQHGPAGDRLRAPERYRHRQEPDEDAGEEEQEHRDRRSAREVVDRVGQRREVEATVL